MKKVVFLVILGALVWAFGHLFGAKTYTPGILVKNDPEQEIFEAPQEKIKKGDFVLTPLASYTIEARVLHTKHYWSGEIASLAPYDVAVGWGVMSDQQVLDQLTISQGNRFYFFEYEGAPPVPKGEIVSHSSNMHLIPSSFGIRQTIAWLKSGDLVRMKGLLVEAVNPSVPGMKPWHSSLSRTDTGNGACEIMWVESIEKLHSQ